MGEMQMGAVETRFAQIIWDNEPISAAQLAKLALEALGWKKTTSYTALKRLCDKGIFKNEGGIVTSVLSRGDYDARQSEKFVSENFSGSLPAFIAAFTQKGSITQEELTQIRKMLDDYEKGGA